MNGSPFTAKLFYFVGSWNQTTYEGRQLRKFRQDFLGCTLRLGRQSSRAVGFPMGEETQLGQSTFVRAG
jgi:hypothetical protein